MCVYFGIRLGLTKTGRGRSPIWKPFIFAQLLDIENEGVYSNHLLFLVLAKRHTCLLKFPWTRIKPYFNGWLFRILTNLAVRITGENSCRNSTNLPIDLVYGYGVYKLDSFKWFFRKHGSSIFPRLSIWGCVLYPWNFGIFNLELGVSHWAMLRARPGKLIFQWPVDLWLKPQPIW